MAKASTTQRLLQAAESALIDGAGDLEMRDVARRAGLSEGLAYHYFGNKAGLVTAVLTAFFERYSDVLNQHRDRDIPWAERERDRVDALAAFLLTDPFAPLALTGLSRLPETATAEVALRRDLVARATENIQSGQAQGAIPAGLDPVLSAAAVLGAVNAAAAQALETTPVPSTAQLAAGLWRIVAAIVELDEATA